MKEIKNKILFERLGLFKQNISSAIKQQEYNEVLSELKKVYDKYQLFAYYDVRFNVLNQIKLTENIKELHMNKTKKHYNLLFVNLKKMNCRYYSPEKEAITLEMNKIIKKIKNELKKRTNFTVDNEFYLYNDNLVFLVSQDKVKKLYRSLKTIMSEFTLIEWKIYFEKMESKQTKSLKTLETCYLKILDKIKNNTTEENTTIENKE